MKFGEIYDYRNAEEAKAFVGKKEGGRRTANVHHNR